MSALPASSAPPTPRDSYHALDFSNGPGNVRYGVAGIVYCAARPVPQLAAFKTDALADPAPQINPEPPGWRHSRTGFVAHEWRDIGCQTTASGLTVTCGDLGPTRISYSGEIHSSADLSDATWVQLLCGPLLPLSLALRGIFLLHGASCLMGKAAVVLAGESGAGKSTLSSWLERAGHVAMADDAVALQVHPARLAGPYPQPKWPGWTSSDFATGAIPKAIVFLQPDSSQPPRLRPLDEPQATLALARHTVAASLFPPQLLSRHLLWCADLARQVPCYALTYEQRPTQLEPMRQLLQEQLDV